VLFVAVLNVLADVARAWRIFQQYKDKGFSFTDCISFAVMERHKIRAAFAFDEHVRQYGRFTVYPGRRIGPYTTLLPKTTNRNAAGFMKTCGIRCTDNVKIGLHTPRTPCSELFN